MAPRIDRKTRKRIQHEEKLRAEEAYRAQVRQEMADQPWAQAQPRRRGISPLWAGFLLLMFAGMLLQLGGGDSVDSGPTAEEQLRASTGYVSAAQEGDTWPFTFSEGVLDCPRGSAVVITPWPDGQTYALNGTASAMAEQEGWVPLEESGVWKDSPEPYIPKVSIGEMIRRGLELCQ